MGCLYQITHSQELTTAEVVVQANTKQKKAEREDLDGLMICTPESLDLHSYAGPGLPVGPVRRSKVLIFSPCSNEIRQLYVHTEVGG